MTDMRSYLIGLFVGRAMKEQFVQSDNRLPDDYYQYPMDWYLHFDADILAEVIPAPALTGGLTFDGAVLQPYE